MFDALAVFIPLIPLLGALIIGLGALSGFLVGEYRETLTADIATWALSMTSLLALTVLGADILGENDGVFHLGNWLTSDNLNINVSLITSGFNVKLAALFALLLTVACKFAVNYMHREAGFHRFFFLLSLFAAAMLWLVLSGSTVCTFMGWEIAGVCSYLLIGYAYDRPVATQNATRVFVTNRIGDAGFVAGIALTYSWINSFDWLDLNTAATEFSSGQVNGIALCFAVAAMAKSAQFPFTPWLARAMEGPTPSSAIFYGAVMVHAGVFLLILLQPIFAQAPLGMALLIVTGLLTATYSFFVGLTQTDVKSSLIFAGSAQLGLMFLECGLGLWQLASWHLAAHAVVRGYQFFTAPALMHQVINTPIKPLMPGIAKVRWLYTAALQRCWLDQITDWALVKPIRGLAHDLSYFDDYVIDRLIGVPAPAIRAASSFAQQEEQSLGARLENDYDNFAQGTGLAGKITEWFAALSHWFEERFILRTAPKDVAGVERKFGRLANNIERIILRPRYLVLFVFITLLIAF